MNEATFLVMLAILESFRSREDDKGDAAGLTLLYGTR